LVTFFSCLVVSGSKIGLVLYVTKSKKKKKKKKKLIA